MEKEMDIFAKAWLFLYTAAGENLGFKVTVKEPQESDIQPNQSCNDTNITHDADVA